MKLNYMKVSAGVLSWKQVEARDGRVFMRLKKRSVSM